MSKIIRGPSKPDAFPLKFRQNRHWESQQYETFMTYDPIIVTGLLIYRVTNGNGSFEIIFV